MVPHVLAAAGVSTLKPCAGPSPTGVRPPDALRQIVSDRRRSLIQLLNHSSVILLFELTFRNRYPLFGTALMGAARDEEMLHPMQDIVRNRGRKQAEAGENEADDAQARSDIGEQHDAGEDRG